MNSRPKNPKYARNKNILVVGGSGSGKTRFFVKPSLMQMHSSYVVTDPKGELLLSCGKLLKRGGYKIKVLNTINFKKSMKMSFQKKKRNQLYRKKNRKRPTCLKTETISIFKPAKQAMTILCISRTLQTLTVGSLTTLKSPLKKPVMKS